MTRWLPSVGFVFLLFSIALGTTFLVWGVQRPVLDEVWELEIQLRSGGRGPLGEREFDVLDDSLRRYPTLAGWFLDEDPSGLISTHRSGFVDVGYAYWIRTDRAQRTIRMESHEQDESIDLVAYVKTVDGELRLRGPSTSPLDLSLPEPSRLPQLIEIRIRRQEKGKIEKKLEGVQLAWSVTSTGGEKE